MKGVNGFTFFKNYYDAITDPDNGLTAEEQGELYNAIFAYMFEDVLPSLKGACRMAFNLIKPSLDKSKVRSAARTKEEETEQTEEETGTNRNQTQSNANQKKSNEIKPQSNEKKTDLSPSMNKEKEQERALQKKYEEAKKKAEEQNNSAGSNSGSTSTGGVSSKGFIRPVKSGKITATMYYSSGKYHGAVDFGVSVGTPVYAAADGIVVTSTWGGSDSYGYYVKIKHYNGYYTLYAHASSLVAKVGQEVKQGDLIMYSGNTGNSTGPHLHYEVRKSPGGYNDRVNPMNFLP